MWRDLRLNCPIFCFWEQKIAITVPGNKEETGEAVQETISGRLSGMTLRFETYFL
jgi:hypothetical protein